MNRLPEPLIEAPVHPEPLISVLPENNGFHEVTLELWSQVVRTEVLPVATTAAEASAVLEALHHEIDRRVPRGQVYRKG